MIEKYEIKYTAIKNYESRDLGEYCNGLLQILF